MLDLFYLAPDVSAAFINELAQRAWIAGADSVYVTVSERDLVDDRKLRTAIDAIHARDMRVILDPYIGGTFSSDEGDSAAPYLAAHPGDRSIAADGTPGNVPTVASPGYRARMADTLQALLAYDVDALLLDEPQLPQTATSFFPADQWATAEFQQRFGYPMSTTWTADVTSFRQAILADFIVTMLAAAESVRPDIPKILVAIDDRFNGADGYGTNDWHLLSNLPYLDEFATDPYVANANFLPNMAKLRSVDRPGLRLGMWSSAFNLGTNLADYDRIRDAINAEWIGGIEHISVWISETGFPNVFADLAIERMRQGFADPIGQLQEVATRREGIEIAGWALDRDTQAPIDVLVSIDGRPWGRVTADRHQPGLDRLFASHGSGHGFRALIPTDLVFHEVCVAADNVGRGIGPIPLGCQSGH